MKTRLATTILVLAVLLSVAPAEAKPDYLRTYEAGLLAVEREDWDRAAELMQKALMARGDEANRLGRYMYWKPYLPQYYYGVARFHLKDCSQAMRAFELSEEQGVLLNNEEFYAEMLTLRDECEARGSQAAQAGPGDSQEKRVRVADYAQSGQRILDAAAPLATSESDRKKLEQTKTGLNVVATTDKEAQRLGEMGDGSAPPALDRAIDAFFGGNPAQALTILEPLTSTDPKTNAHAKLLSAAAAYRLYLLSAQTNQALYEKAVRFVRAYRATGHSVTTPQSLFSPRFLEFLASQS